MDSSSPSDGPSAVVIGVDYGTLSGRAVVVRVSDGVELASAVHEYPHAVIERALPSSGKVLPPDWALQVPSDYVDVLKIAVPAALAASGVSADQVIGLGTDFTACTVLPVLADGTPLSELPEFVDEPHAYVKLWKHHAAQSHADRINAAAHERGESWINRYGGKLSAEWALAKGLELFEDAPDVYARAEHIVEAADWIVWQLTGDYVRNACTAGYKEVRQDGQYPSAEYLESLNPGFGGFFRDKIEHPVGELGDRAGGLSAEAAGWTGLPEGIAVSVGNVDAHVTAAAAQALDPGQMVAIMGTSTCHVMNSDQLGEVPGMCGVVDGGIVKGLWGYEAGQSAVGDIFGWFIDSGVPQSYRDEAERLGLGMHEYLTSLAAQQAVGQTGLIALDWHNCNRSVLVDHTLSAVLVGQTLATTPEDVYRALLEATAFGTRTIVEAFQKSGVPVTELIVAGGLLKNALLMQIYADVTRLPLSVIGSDQGPALGSAIHAAVAAGAYPDVRTASASMGRSQPAAYLPDENRARAYDALFAEYTLLHDYFGRGGNDVMHRLREIRRVAFER
jgi:L-ribulokinase